MDRLLQDLRFAARGVRCRPGYSLLVVLTLGLGIGGNTAIFSVVNAVALRPLPVPDAARVFKVVGVNQPRRTDDSNVSLPDMQELVARSEQLATGGAYTVTSRNLSLGEFPERVEAALVAGDLFGIFGMHPLAGRLLTADDSRPGAPPVVLVSESFWRQRFDGRPDAVGTMLRINGTEQRLVGVVSAMPAVHVEIFQPLADDGPAGARRNRFLRAYVHLAPGATSTSAQAEVDSVASSLAEELPESNADWEFRLRPLRTDLFGDAMTPLALLLAVVGVVLLVACSNVASLTLARAAGRSREVALRAALGAGRSRIVRQLLVESLSLSLGAGALGVLVGILGAGLLRARLLTDLPPVTGPDLDATVLLFTFCVSLLTGLVFGLAPALRASQPDLVTALGQGGTTVAGERGRTRGALVVAEVCLAMLLLATAGLLLTSLGRALTRDVGFDAQGVLTMRLDLPSDRYPETTLAPFVGGLVERIERLPGVTAAAATSQLPMDASRTARGFKRPDLPDPALEEARWATWVSVTPGYLQAVGARIIEGRTLSADDDASAEPVTVVNRAMARELYGGESAVGRGVHIWTDEPRPRRIVGVVDDLTDRPFADEAIPQYFVPLAQSYKSRLALVLRVDGDADTLASVRRILKAEDADLPVYDARWLREVVATRSAGVRVLSSLISGFAALALGLAALGLYGVVAQSVISRTREMGVRLAMGADPGGLRRLVIGQAMRLSGAGALLGLPLAIAVTQLLRNRIPGVDALPVAAYGALMLVVLSATLLAAYLPARRATRVDPVVVLRNE